MEVKYYICKHCGNIIEISKKDKTCFCSECGNNFSKEQGQEAISRKYKSLQNLAYRLAYDRLDYEGAIQAYKESLQLKSNDFSSIIGIILCKLYGQTFDKLEFKEIINILNSYDISLNNENTFIYLNFIKDVLGQVNVFYEESTSRLMKDGKFINSQYKTYFLDGLKDIHEALLFLKDNLSICYEPEVKEFSESDDTLKNLDLVISKVEDDLNKDLEVEKEETTLDDLSVIIVDEKAPLYYVGTAKKYPPMLFLIADNDIENRYEQTVLMMSTLKHFGYNMDKINMKLIHSVHCEYVEKTDENNESILGQIILDFILNN